MAQRKSGGEQAPTARTPNATRGLRTPGSREAFGLRMASVPLFERDEDFHSKRQDANAQEVPVCVSPGDNSPPKDGLAKLGCARALVFIFQRHSA